MWCRDGLALCRGKVDTKGEQLEILEDADEEPNDVNRIARPKEWRRYQAAYRTWRPTRTAP